MFPDIKWWMGRRWEPMDAGVNGEKGEGERKKEFKVMSELLW